MWKILVFIFISAASAAYYEDLVERVQPELQKHNAKWTAGHNKRFAGKSKEYLAKLAGTKMDKISSPKVYPKMPDADAVPDTFDARSNWPMCPSIGLVRDQACCDSSSAVSTAATMSDRHCIDSSGAVQVYLSDEDISLCCSYCGSGGCGGGYPISAFLYWVESGVVTGGPYGSHQGCKPSVGCGDAQPLACNQTCEPGYSTPYNSDKHFGASYYKVGNGVSGMQQELFINGPIVSAFNVYEDFCSYTSGVYHHVYGQFVGGLAVKVIGWGTEDNTPYWLAANSWNETWGMQGLFKIIRGTNDCDFESSICAGQAKN